VGGEVAEAAARALLRDYVHALDRGALTTWPTFFTDPCLYRITTRDNEERGFPLSIMLCNNRSMLYDRIEATEKANIYEPHSYRHVLSDTEVVARGADALSTRTSFLCVRIMHDGATTLFTSGEYLDEIVLDEGRPRYRAKTVVLDQSRIDTLIAIPL
jgi:anthranilate 1,2-dioxygenase small subunit